MESPADLTENAGRWRDHHQCTWGITEHLGIWGRQYSSSSACTPQDFNQGWWDECMRHFYWKDQQHVSQTFIKIKKKIFMTAREQFCCLFSLRLNSGIYTCERNRFPHQGLCRNPQLWSCGTRQIILWTVLPPKDKTDLTACTYPFYHLFSLLELCQPDTYLSTFQHVIVWRILVFLIILHQWTADNTLLNYSVLKQLFNIFLCFNKYTNLSLLKNQNYFQNSKFSYFFFNSSLFYMSWVQCITHYSIRSLTASTEPSQTSKGSNTFCAPRENKLSVFLLLCDNL